jgi:hypothetical protein
MAGDPRFHELLDEIGRLHDKKQQDYGTDVDPFANVRASEEFGVAPWIGSLVRMNDKVTRLKSFARKGTLANESVEDSLLDIAVYALIGLILYREEDPDLLPEERIIERLKADPGVQARAEALADIVDDMCPNCVTPWKCNGPHLLPDHTFVDKEKDPSEEGSDTYYDLGGVGQPY